MTPEERKSIIQMHIRDSANQHLREARERAEKRQQQNIQRREQEHQEVVRYQQQVGVHVGMVAQRATQRAAQEEAQTPKNYDDMPVPLYDYSF